jgi:predicted deacylase
MIASVVLMIPLCAIACQQTLVSPNVEAAPLIASVTPEELLIAPTRNTNEIIFPTPVQNTEPPIDPTLIQQMIVPISTATLLPDTTLVGLSVEGRAILARSFGSGSKHLLLVGGIHGGWESNTITLINQLMTHFAANPDEILPHMTITLIPAANPDGLVKGREEMGRFNANGVDLNRNWGCEWSADAVWRNQSVNAGDRAFSEPETQYIVDFIRQTRPDTVLFYHSAAGGVFAGNCEGDHGSMLMAEILGQATGYSYGQPFTAYRVTGTAASWVDGEGIPSADVELFSWTDSEFERNLAGIRALQEWLKPR